MQRAKAMIFPILHCQSEEAGALGHAPPEREEKLPG